VQHALGSKSMQPPAITEGLALLHAIAEACCTHASCATQITHAFLSQIAANAADVAGLMTALADAEPVMHASSISSPVDVALKSWLLLAWQIAEVIASWPGGTQAAILHDASTSSSLLHASIRALEHLSFPEARAISCRYRPATCAR
jgi:hypothetical protein